MDHSEAVRQMAAERYLLNELAPELREAFEQHVFDCPECALDLRAAAAFVDEAKVQLPELTSSSPLPSLPAPTKPATKKTNWFFWWQPAFALPAFAVLLAVIGYQNLATIPNLRLAADEPRLLPWVSLHAGTRGAAHTPVLADRKQGAVLLIDLPQSLAYTSYAFDLYDPQSKRYWTGTVSMPNEDSEGARTVSLLIPGSGLQQGSYTLSISGISSPGGRTEIDRRVFDIHFDD
jgi:hypothetical protein